MPTTIPQQYLDLFQKKAFAHLATLMRDGQASGLTGVVRLRRHMCADQLRQGSGERS